jgi:predicted peptidase
MKRIEHREDKYPFCFVEYAPENTSDNLPLIIQLHGAGERGNDLSLVDVHGFSKTLAVTDIECRFIMPQCPAGTFWAARVESIVCFVEMLIEDFSADPDRVYLTGLSMGGYGTWYTAMARPDLFAAIAPICGGGMAWNAITLRMPVRVFHGVDDRIVSVTQSDEMVKALQGGGRMVEYTRMEGVGHNVWEYAYNKELAEWLLDKKRK